VPEFSECTNPDTMHVLPLNGASCSNPTLESGLLTTSTTGKGTASALLAVRAGDPANPADEADVDVGASTTDVLSTSSDSDYEGQLLLRWTMRITDRANGPSGADAATVQDLDFSLPVDCVATSDTALGSSCNVNSTLNTLVPGFAKEGKRAVISTFSFALTDAGADGTVMPSSGACPPTCGSGDEHVFLRQGVFAP
jgi:hypothetical protein